jgi:hypothetical protein
VGALGTLYSVQEYVRDKDKTFGHAAADAADNAITVTIAAVEDKKHYLGSVLLTATAGDGGSETLVIKHGTTTVWSEVFTVGTDLIRQFQAVPLVSDENEVVTVEASATALTAGKLFVVYYTK